MCWQGYAWTSASNDGSTIYPANFSTITSASLCVSGSVAPEADYSGYAMLGLNINQALAANSPTNTVVLTANGVDGVDLDVTNNDNTALRVQIAGPTGNSSDIWCATITGPNMNYPWSSFNTACWDGSGTAYSGQPIQSIAVLVPGGATDAVPFNFCLNSVAPL